MAESATIPVDHHAWITAVQSAWQLSGQRLTDQRLRVLRQITSYARPFSAEQLYADLQQLDPPLGRATVYRTLERLTRGGWVARIHTQGPETGYIASWPGHFHHLVCVDCGRVVAFEGCMMGDLLTNLAQQTDFVIQEHLLQIYGRCANCRQTSRN